MWKRKELCLGSDLVDCKEPAATQENSFDSSKEIERSRRKGRGN